MKCKAKKADGKQCRGNSLQSGEYCYRHDQEMRREALQASSEGGKARRQYTQLGKSMKLETPRDIKKLMEKAINSLWTGKMPANNPAGSLGYLAKTFLEAYDKSELETRVEELEKRLNQANI